MVAARRQLNTQGIEGIEGIGGLRIAEVIVSGILAAELNRLITELMLSIALFAAETVEFMLA